MDAPALRAAFPVCATSAYLNSGTCGPLPRAAVEAMAAEAERFLAEGRAPQAYYGRLFDELLPALRSAYAGVLGADPVDVGVTTSTSEGIVRVLAGLDLGPGDEVLIADYEHPGLLGPLGAARERIGLSVRVVPLADIAGAVDEHTRLVACSHVGWTTGEVVPSLADLPDDVPVLLDGAQGAGAIDVDVGELGCAFYAASGQKWMCGPVGTGMLWVSPTWRERLAAPAPTYVNLADPGLGINSPPWPDGRAFDSPALAVETVAAALAAHDTLAAHGWPEVHARAVGLAAEFGDALRAAGREVAPRGETTLVSWTSPDPDAEVARLGEAGVVARGFAGLPWVRASVGAWNDGSDLDRLLGAMDRGVSGWSA